MTAIAIFVKTPGLSPVKSRLAATIGRELAEACHLRSARTVAAVARSAGVGPVYWAVAEQEADGHSLWQDLPVLVQPGGDLGSRMNAIHDRLVADHGCGVLLGADLPQLDAAALHMAERWLNHASGRGVIGPASDGGFWLVGANRCLPAVAWQAPDYGRGAVLQRFVEALGDDLDWQQLAACCDLDRIEDLPAVMAELKNLVCPHPAQRRLLDWLVAKLAPCHPTPTSA
ncbi:MAG: DUF2064 domain-containing protein [Wenzhouxiangella sp.]